MSRLLMLGGWLILTINLTAQHPIHQFTPNQDILHEAVSPTYHRFIEQFMHRPIAAKRSKVNFDKINLQLHLIHRSDGTGGVDSNQVINAILAVNPFFTEAEVEFQIAGVNIINEDDFYNMESAAFENGSATNRMIRTHYRAGKINCYVVGDLSGNISSSATNIGRRDFFILDHDALHPVDIAKNLGFCFWLWNTHGLFDFSEQECFIGTLREGPVPGLADELVCNGAVRYDNQPTLDENGDGIPDCQQTGDKVCDTPASPNLTGLMNDNCQYTGNLRDNNGDLYQPDPTNLMSNSPRNCRLRFSTEQLARIRFYYENQGSQLNCQDCNSNENANDRIVVVTNTQNEGVGSLRQVMACANIETSATTITFDNGLSDSIIPLVTRLPNILTDSLMIDGSNAPNGRIIIDGQQLNSLFDNGLGLEDFWANIQYFHLKNVIIRNMPRDGFIAFGQAKAIILENCQIENSGRVFSGTGLNFQNSESIQLKNVTIEGSSLNGIRFNQCTNITVDSFSIQNVGTYGIRSSENRQVIYTNGNIQHTGLQSEFGDGILIDRDTSVQITNMTINNTGRIGVFGLANQGLILQNVALSNCGLDGLQIGAQANNIDITNLTIQATNRHGINTNQNQQLSISNFTIAQTGQHAIFCRNGQGLMIQNGMIQQTGLQSEFGDGIVVENNTDNTFQNIEFNSIRRNGILSVANNNTDFRQIRMQQVGVDGIFLDNPTNNNRLFNIQLEDIGNDGIRSRGDMGLRVDSFYLNQIGRIGILSFNNPSLTIQNGTISNTGTNSEFGDGIQLENTENANIQNIKIENTRRIGLFLINQLNGQYANLKLSDCQQDALQISNNSQNLRFENFEIATIGRHGIASFQNQNIQFLNGTIHQTGLSSNFGDGIFTTGDSLVLIQGVTTEQTGQNGIGVQSSQSLQIYKNQIQQAGRQGIALENAQHVFLGDANLENIITESAGYGIKINEKSKQIEIANNYIGLDISNNALPNDSSGIFIDNASQITIGIENEPSNHIAYHPQHSVLVQNAEKILLLNNSFFCNELGLSITTMDSATSPIIQNISPIEIVGTATPNAIIWLYQSDMDCNYCEGKTLLAQTQSDANGTWKVSLSTSLAVDQKITAMANREGASSNFSNCQTLPMTTSTVDVLTGLHLEVYPNPTDGTVWIQIPKSELYHFELLNTQGQILQNFSSLLAGNQQQQIDLSAYSKGIYWLKATSKNQTKVQALIKQ